MAAANRRVVTLTPEASAPARMVLVDRAGPCLHRRHRRTVPLTDFWIDKFEVTNSEFKQFVDAGGYREAKYWKEPFHDGADVLAFDEALARFRDSTGRPGPAAWQLGSFPDGQADFPVGGISWFEATAYAEFRGQASADDLSLVSRFEPRRSLLGHPALRQLRQQGRGEGRRASGLRSVGHARHGRQRQGVVRERRRQPRTCATSSAAGGTSRATATASPMHETPGSARPTFGMRLIKDRAGVAGGRPRSCRAHRAHAYLRRSEKRRPRLGRALRRLPSLLHVRPGASRGEAGERRRQLTVLAAGAVTFAAAYGRERVPAHLFLPKNASPPYQTVVLFPSAYALNASSSSTLDLSRFDFIVRSGRALLYPVYQGTFERRQADGRTRERPARHAGAAGQGLLPRRRLPRNASGHRHDAARLLQPQHGRLLRSDSRSRSSRGSRSPSSRRRACATTTRPRSSPPTSRRGSRCRSSSSTAGTISRTRPNLRQRLLELLGTPPDQKKLVTLEGGHVPNDMLGVIRNVLDWYDTYLGPVK